MLDRDPPNQFTSKTLHSHNLKLSNKPLGGFITLQWKVSANFSLAPWAYGQNFCPELRVAKSLFFRHTFITG